MARIRVLARRTVRAHDVHVEAADSHCPLLYQSGLNGARVKRRADSWSPQHRAVFLASGSASTQIPSASPPARRHDGLRRVRMQHQPPYPAPIPIFAAVRASLLLEPELRGSIPVRRKRLVNLHVQNPGKVRPGNHRQENRAKRQDCSHDVAGKRSTKRQLLIWDFRLPLVLLLPRRPPLPRETCNAGKAPPIPSADEGGHSRSSCLSEASGCNGAGYGG